MRFPGAGTISFGYAEAAWADIDARLRRLAGDEAELRRKFWKKLKSVAARLPFAGDLLAAYYCAFDRDTPLYVKTALIGTLAYFVLPTDIVPDFLPVLGYADDAASLAATLKLVASHITPEHRD